MQNFETRGDQKLLPKKKKTIDNLYYITNICIFLEYFVVFTRKDKMQFLCHSVNLKQQISL